MAISMHHVEGKADRGVSSHLPVEDSGQLIGDKLTRAYIALNEIVEAAVQHCGRSCDGFEHNDPNDSNNNDGCETPKIQRSNLLRDEDQRQHRQQILSAAACPKQIQENAG